MPFTGTASGGVTLWLGDPDCQAAHDSILAWLKLRTKPENFRNFSPVPSEPDNILKGNLGEAISFCVGVWNNFSEYIPFPANAFNPLGTIAKSDIDIIWIFFDEIGTDDVAIVQEVKTTSDSSLGLADRLIDDYDKLFGTAPKFTLRTRLDAIKTEIEYQLKRPELLHRVDQLAGNSPRTSSKIILVPTLVHEGQETEPQKKMVAIRSTLCSPSKGWSSSAVEAWAIGLSDLNNRLIRLAMGQN
jgi:hypothetical protein